MVRINSALIIRLVTGKAGMRWIIEIVVYMTFIAIKCPVSGIKHNSGSGSMVK